MLPNFFFTVALRLCSDNSFRSFPVMPDSDTSDNNLNLKYNNIRLYNGQECYFFGFKIRSKFEPEKVAMFR